MRYVNFIKSLNVEKLPLTGTDIQYYSNNFTVVDDAGRPAFLHTLNTTREVVPVHIISKREYGKRTDTYIAYTKEVENLLGTPFKAIKEENDRLYRYYESKSFWQRLKFLFTGKIKR